MRYLLGERLYRETLLARPLIRSTDILTLNIPMGYIKSSTLSWIVKLYENTYDITIETSLDNGETWRPHQPGEQIPGLTDVSIVKPTKLLVRTIVDTTNAINPADITDIILDIDYSSIGHYAICSDGRAYFNGQEINGEPDFISIGNGELKIKGGGRKVDELYVTPRLLTKEEIDLLRQTQYELQDPREGIDAGFRKISHISGEIDADGHTIYANIQGQNKIVAHYGIDPETGDRGLFVFDIDEQGNPVEIGFTGRRGDGTVVGFGGGGFTPGSDIVAGNITPATDNLSIGTTDAPFASIYADEIHTSAVNTETVEVKDNIIVLNKGQVGSGVSAGLAGIKIDRGDAPDYMIVFDEEEDMFKVGMAGNLETIASQNYVQSQLENFEPDIKDADTLDGYHAIEILEMMYPVGSIYFNGASNVNPASLFGFGTWERFGKGRVLVGVDESQAEFNAAGKTGGAKDVKLTVAQMPKHSHKFRTFDSYDNNTARSPGAWEARSHQTWETETTGGDQPHPNMPPYITVYMWIRIA